jgi:hypothetical protein
MLPIWTERAHVARRLVYESVTNRFVLSLEAFAVLVSWAAFNRAEVWVARYMDFRMRSNEISVKELPWTEHSLEQILGLEWPSGASRIVTFEASCGSIDGI